MSKQNTEVLLTIELEGRLGAPVPKNKKWDRKKQNCIYSVTWSAPQVKFLTSTESALKGMTMAEWVKLPFFKKLLAHAKEFAQDVTHENNPKFHIELIQHKD